MPSTPAVSAASPFISPLPRPSSTKLRSAVITPSIPDILRELVQNSLDAGTGRFDIWLDLTSGSERIRVEDSGSGIDQEGMKKIGRRYGWTISPYIAPKAHCRIVEAPGEGLPISTLKDDSYAKEVAIASISALCMLEITSKPKESENTWTKIIKDSKFLFEGPSSRPLPRDHGTTVIITDIFQKIPVRQASLASQSASSTIAACKKVVESLALVYPSVKWGMWEEQSGSGAAAKRILQLNGGKTALDVFKAVYGSAGKVQTIRVSSGTRRIDGFISLEGALTQTHQHLYINHFPLERSEISRAISKRFAVSKFSMMTDDSAVDFTPGRRKSPRRLERYPIYVLDIALPPTDVDLAYEPRKGTTGFKNEDAVKAFVLAVVDEFLKRHNFIFPHRVLEEPVSAIASATPMPVSLPEYEAYPTTPVPHRQQAKASDTQVSFAESAFWRARKSTGITPTGTSHPIRQFEGMRGQISGAPPPPPSSLGKRKIGWIDDIVSDVQGHILPFTPPPLFPNDDKGEDTQLDLACVSCAKSHSRASCSSVKRSRLRTTASNIDIDPMSLGKAEVLDQVDAKFIACCLPSDASRSAADCSSTIILVDQHAADERIAVEAILKELCEGFLHDDTAVRFLESPPSVIMTRREASYLASSEVEDILRRWGVILDTVSLDLMEDSALEYFQIPILGVPECLEFRLSNKDPREISHLLKIHLPFLSEHMEEQGAFLKAAKEESVDWERAMPWMPKEMLELANSKACRNAIMFGDRLTQEQCSRLVKQLSTTRHPFICAHGRPSFVPMISIAPGHDDGMRGIDWGRWKAGRQG